MRYARTLDSATVKIHSALIDAELFVKMLKKGVDNNCYMLSKDASEDVVSLTGKMDDTRLILNGFRDVKAIEKGPTSVKTLDIQFNDLVLVHYHCGISPEPSAIDINTMKLALKAQILATIPGRPRVFGIASPTVVGRSFCLDLALYEPVPKMNIGYDTSSINVKDYSFLKVRKKAFLRYEVEEGELVSYGEICVTPEDGCVPYRYGSTDELVLEDFIFIASYRINTSKEEFIFIKLSDIANKAYYIKVFSLNIDEIVIRVVPWKVFHKASTKGL